MRIFKLLLILISLLVLLSFTFAGFIIFSSNGKTALYGYVHLFLGLLTSALSIIFHLKSYRYYRKKKKNDYNIKIPKTIWIGEISFATFIVYIAVVAIIGYLKERTIGEAENIKLILFIVVSTLVIAVLNIVEVVFLEKRVKKGTIAQEQLHEIDEIGN